MGMGNSHVYEPLALQRVAPPRGSPELLDEGAHESQMSLLAKTSADFPMTERGAQEPAPDGMSTSSAGVTSDRLSPPSSARYDKRPLQQPQMSPQMGPKLTTSVTVTTELLPGNG